MRRVAGVAAVVLLILAVILYSAWPIALDGFLPASLPRIFWVLLAIILAVGAIGCLSLSGDRIPAGGDRAESPLPEPLAPVPEETVLADAAIAPALPTGVPLAAARLRKKPAPAVDARNDSEISKILDWLRGVESEISQWTVEIKESIAPRRAVEEPGPTHLEVSENGEGIVTVGWTEQSARSAIERYLRKRPWAPASDVAKALGMNLGLATRVTESVREERGLD